MTERPLSRLYLPWLSWIVLAFVAILAIAVIGGAAVLISSHQFRTLMRLLVGILVLMIGSTFLLVKLRKRFDQFIQTDGETFIRLWTPLRDVVLDRHLIEAISFGHEQIVVEGSQGTITIDRRYPEFESLKKVLETWHASPVDRRPRIVPDL